ncbi:MAG: hypothetical protein SGPRY_001934 [Prymnesium sp.]
MPTLQVGDDDSQECDDPMPHFSFERCERPQQTWFDLQKAGTSQPNGRLLECDTWLAERSILPRKMKGEGCDPFSRPLAD